MKLTSAIGGGVAGAIVLTAIHETVRRLVGTAPRMDLLGMEALEETLEAANAEIPEEDTLFKLTMAGDIISNSAYYALAGIGKEQQAVLRGAVLGLVAGIGAVYLPEPLRLNEAPSNRARPTQLMTVALYAIGGLAAGAVGKLIENKT